MQGWEREKPPWESKWRGWRLWCGIEHLGALCVTCHLPGTALLDRQAFFPFSNQARRVLFTFRRGRNHQEAKWCIDVCPDLGKSSLLIPVQTVHESWECILISSWRVTSGYSLIANEAVTGSQSHRQQQLLLVFEWQSALPFVPAPVPLVKGYLLESARIPVLKGSGAANDGR